MDFFLLKNTSSSSTSSFVGTRKAGEQVVWMAGVDDIPRGRLERARSALAFSGSADPN